MVVVSCICNIFQLANQPAFANKLWYVTSARRDATAALNTLRTAILRTHLNAFTTTGADLTRKPA